MFEIEGSEQRGDKSMRARGRRVLDEPEMPDKDRLLNLSLKVTASVCVPQSAASLESIMGRIAPAST
ncbi:hypothetical protein ILYODFUR_025200 [Ilyodon furcidens]|uniref:Uncharacterized protein n=1 Tax=Ilyodon furcidens TaxID=33524 RepID=A0ABV0V7L2_9TELE